MFTLITGGRRSGRERKALAVPSTRGAASALVRAVSPHPRGPDKAIQAVPAEMALRSPRRVIPTPNLSCCSRSTKSTLSSASRWYHNVAKAPTLSRESAGHAPARTLAGPGTHADRPTPEILARCGFASACQHAQAFGFRFSARFRPSTLAVGLLLLPTRSAACNVSVSTAGGPDARRFALRRLADKPA
jgi:hypothetical protein